MTSSIKYAPPNLFVAIADNIRSSELPDYPTESGMAATETCIFVGCESAIDPHDDVSFTIGLDHRLNTSGRPIFEKIIETPNRKVCVWTTEFEKILEEKVPTERTRVRIWGNRPKYPDEIIIGVSEAD